jgi:hypothetical protein
MPCNDARMEKIEAEKGKDFKTVFVQKLLQYAILGVDFLVSNYSEV